MSNVSQLNGNAQPVAMIRNVLNSGGVNRIVYTLSNGQYVGSLTFDGQSTEAVKAMADDFQAFMAEQAGSLLKVPPGTRLPAPPNRQ